MSRSARRIVIAGLLSGVVLAFAGAAAPPARANILDKACGLLGEVADGWLGKACDVVAHPKQLIGAAKALAGGRAGQAIKVLLGEAKSNVLSGSGAVGIAAVVAWAVGGAHFVLREIAKFVGSTTSPQLTAAWFASVYWRVAAIAALLTLPFLCAAAIQAILRSELALLARAVFGYLPLAFLATGLAAPLAMLLLALTDSMSASVAGAAGGQGAHFLEVSGAAIGALGVAAGSPFITFLIALLTAAGGLILWLELLIREAAVYVVVLMLPLVFCAMVWPARRVWAARACEVLAALILAKFAIVAVLALAAAALGHVGGSLIVRSLAGLVLVMLGAFAPWVLLRLLPLAEVASAAVGHVRDHAHARISGDASLGRQGLAVASAGVGGLLTRMRSLADDAVTVSAEDTGASAATTRLQTLTASASTAQTANATPPADTVSPAGATPQTGAGDAPSDSATAAGRPQMPAPPPADAQAQSTVPAEARAASPGAPQATEPPVLGEGADPAARGESSPPPLPAPDPHHGEQQ